MLLTITYRGSDTAKLGYLLYKNPNRPQCVELNYTNAYVFYPKVSDEETTVALLLDIDPVDLAKRRSAKGGYSGLFDYVNDRPYVSSSFMSTAIKKVFGTAATGRCDNYQELADSKLDLEASLTMLPCRGELQKLNEIFEPLGYEVSYEMFKPQGFEHFNSLESLESVVYVNLTIRAKVRLRDLIRHLFVLIPVFDKQKHYWVGDDEVKKLLDSSQDWLLQHPQRMYIINRYLHKKRSLINEAFKKLVNNGFDEFQIEEEFEDDEFLNEMLENVELKSAELKKIAGEAKSGETSSGETSSGETSSGETSSGEKVANETDLSERIEENSNGATSNAVTSNGTTPNVAASNETTSNAVTSNTVVQEQREKKKKKIRLNDQRLEAVVSTLRNHHVESVIDLGCGEGKLLKLLMKERPIKRIAGMDVSFSVLKRASNRLNLDRLNDRARERVNLFQSSLTYKDERFEHYDAACIVEVIEHLDLPRLKSLERVVFEYARPKVVIITTPNKEYNAVYAMEEDSFRHADHRFEWTRAEFEKWAKEVADSFGYQVEFKPIGDVDENYGGATQMGVFTL